MLFGGFWLLKTNQKAFLWVSWYIRNREKTRQPSRKPPKKSLKNHSKTSLPSQHPRLFGCAGCAGSCAWKKPGKILEKPPGKMENPGLWWAKTTKQTVTRNSLWTTAEEQKNSRSKGRKACGAEQGVYHSPTKVMIEYRNLTSRKLLSNTGNLVWNHPNLLFFTTWTAEFSI